MPSVPGVSTKSCFPISIYKVLRHLTRHRQDLLGPLFSTPKFTTGHFKDKIPGVNTKKSEYTYSSRQGKHRRFPYGQGRRGYHFILARREQGESRAVKAPTGCCCPAWCICTSSPPSNRWGSDGDSLGYEGGMIHRPATGGDQAQDSLGYEWGMIHRPATGGDQARWLGV